MPTMQASAPVPAGRGGQRAAPAPPGPSNAFIGGPASLYALSSDGRLHRLNTSTGDDMTQPVSVLPANARVAGLNMIDNVIYAVTSQNCSGVEDAVWAIDLNGDSLKAASFEVNGGVLGLGGPVIGSDGTVYVQTGDGPLLALSPRDLKLKRSFMLKGAGSASPAVFPYKNRELIVTAARDGRLYLLDAASAAVLDQTTPIASAEVWGSISSWEEMDGTRWVLASVWGSNGTAPNGSIVAFKVLEQGSKPALKPAWVSRDLSAPMPPVVTSGVVFALSAGKGVTHATLYALDATTGKELYSSRNLVTAPASLTGLTLANGRVYFGALDGTFYTFGMYMEH